MAAFITPYTGIFKSTIKTQSGFITDGILSIRFIETNQIELMFSNSSQITYSDSPSEWVFTLTLSRNETQCFARSDPLQEGEKYKQQVLFIFNLLDEKLSGEYHILCHSDGTFHMDNDLFFKAVIERIPKTDDSVPQIQNNQSEENYCIIL